MINRHLTSFRDSEISNSFRCQLEGKHFKTVYLSFLSFKNILTTLGTSVNRMDYHWPWACKHINGKYYVCNDFITFKAQVNTAWDITVIYTASLWKFDNILVSGLYFFFTSIFIYEHNCKSMQVKLHVVKDSLDTCNTKAQIYLQANSCISGGHKGVLSLYKHIPHISCDFPFRKITGSAFLLYYYVHEDMWRVPLHHKHLA